MKLPKEANVILAGPAIFARVPGRTAPCFYCRVLLGLSYSVEAQAKAIGGGLPYFVVCFSCGEKHLKGFKAKIVPPTERMRKELKEAAGLGDEHWERLMRRAEEIRKPKDS